MHHLLEHINQDITRRYSKVKDSTVNKTEYQGKRNPTVTPVGPKNRGRGSGGSKRDDRGRVGLKKLGRKLLPTS